MISMHHAIPIVVKFIGLLKLVMALGQLLGKIDAQATQEEPKVLIQESKHSPKEITFPSMIINK
jgi:hypothetical protein